jgi:hypothetical protein
LSRDRRGDTLGGVRAERPLRLPLQIGTSALYSLARGGAFATPALIFLVVAIVIVLWLPDMGDASGYLFAALATPGLVLLRFSWKHLKRAHAERPSDLLVDRDGFGVAGGPHRALRVAWRDIAAVELETPSKPKDPDKEEDNTDLRVLTIHARSGTGTKRQVLASAERAGEQRSLRDLMDTLRAAARREPEAAPPSGVDTFACGKCGAALAPADVADVACPYCSHATPVGDTLRVRLRDAASVRARPDTAIARLLDQPGAGRVGAVYVAASVFTLVAWPLAIAAMTAEYARGTLSVLRVAWLVAFVAACIVGLYGAIRGRLVERQALRLVAVEFAALEPVKPGDPYRCQRCVAPLPAPGEARVVVHCVYCAADNVLGLQLGHAARVAREESRSLAEALARRARERRRWRGVGVLALMLIGASAYALVHGLR